MPPGNIMAGGKIFTFDGQLAFLTYPNSGELTKERLADSLRALGASKFRIARELHESGQPHLHAVVYWAKRKRLRGATCLDVDGKHPNIQPVRDLGASLEYLEKSDDQPLDSDPPLSAGDVGGSESKWGYIIGAGDAREFLERAERSCPRDFVLHYRQITEFCEQRFGKRDLDEYIGRHRGQFREPAILKDWARVNLEVNI